LTTGVWNNGYALMIMLGAYLFAMSAPS